MEISLHFPLAWNAMLFIFPFFYYFLKKSPLLYAFFYLFWGSLFAIVSPDHYSLSGGTIRIVIIVSVYRNNKNLRDWGWFYLKKKRKLVRAKIAGRKIKQVIICFLFRSKAAETSGKAFLSGPVKWFFYFFLWARNQGEAFLDILFFQRSRHSIAY